MKTITYTVAITLQVPDTYAPATCLGDFADIVPKPETGATLLSYETIDAEDDEPTD